MSDKAKQTKLEKLLAHLEAAQPFHLEVGSKMARAYGGAVYPVDLLANAVLNRSANLLDGFVILARKRNFICCAPLLRLQIDNCLRFYAVFIVNDCHQFAMDVLQGTPINKMKDRKGKWMTDRHLAEELNKEYPWILRVYERTSGYIHLSNTHIFNTVKKGPDEKQAKGIQEFRMGVGDNFEGDGLYEEAALAFIEATNVLFKYLVGWIETKNNPPKRNKSS
jgi:hypothetical protein